MEKPFVQKAPKRDWMPTQGAFHRLLAWLDEEADSGGQRYLEIADGWFSTSIARTADRPMNSPTKR